MTILQLLALPTDELGALTSDRSRLDAVLQPYLPFTRPAARRATTTITIKDARADIQAALNGTLHEAAPKRRLLTSPKPQ